MPGRAPSIAVDRSGANLAVPGGLNKVYPHSPHLPRRVRPRPSVRAAHAGRWGNTL
ncbi:hypothetical protein BN2476_70009 [Paraburkholderia piptadeniae]|uniref:Uncharacterized protein n=1 Tax=Paraburkholderia piptadeniae TaxID=1701573 RepID=A0A1N7RL47_9BURK|nr:hypothetical protein BN2476_70009 [Paraburkholderia piptadeniae]